MNIGVVIPARDEEELIGRCLASVTRAAAMVRARVHVVVVADGCLDRTVAVARSFRGVRVLEVESSNVGAARAAGARSVLQRGADWIANTDADSTVPLNWLAHQVDLEARGWDVMIGTVRPDFAELSVEQRAAWLSTHGDGQALGNIHGANLGVRASVYRSSGGYEELPEHEDVDLVARLQGARIIASDEAEVVTSARRFGRTPGGYARYLREELATSVVLGSRPTPSTRTAPATR